ncbi:MAG TPA: 3-phosphoshikimate 1-carboxyvinyltransferase, partial [Eubacteriales bacterium]|nr:3-phosphoshikimate 1-carboxyvinyltransferase [Eubacteriales bacterium]
MRAEIRPSRFLGEIAAPVSKSAAHRLLIASALSDGAKILGRLSGEDIQATVRCLSALGAEIAVNENSV